MLIFGYRIVLRKWRKIIRKQLKFAVEAKIVIKFDMNDLFLYLISLDEFGGFWMMKVIIM